MAVRHTKRSRPRRKSYPCPECLGTKTIERASGITEMCRRCNGIGRITEKPKDHVDELYDRFKIKDLTRAQFRREYKRVMSAKRSYRDLNSIMFSRALARERKAAVDEAIRHRR